MKSLVLATLVAAIQTTEPEVPLEIAFELVKGVPLIEVHLGSEGPFTMLVDTGVTPSAVDLGAAQRAGLELAHEPAGEAGGAGGDASRPVFATALRDLRIAGQEQGDPSAVALDLSMVSEGLGQRLDGILGHGFMQGKIIEIDYPGRRIRLHPKRPSLRNDLEHWSQPLVLRAGDVMPVLELTVNGEPVRATLDTGASEGLNLFPPGYRRLGLADAARSGPESGRIGARGRHSVRQGRVDELRLGPFGIADTAVTFCERGEGDATREGNFGGAILREFVLLLDYRGGQITLSRPIAP